MLTGTQVRMARAAVGWGVRELAEKAKINPNTVSRIDNIGVALKEWIGLIAYYAMDRTDELFPGPDN